MSEAQIEIDAYFRVNDGQVEFHCPNTWRPKGAEEWHGEFTDWTPVAELLQDLEAELRQHSQS